MSLRLGFFAVIVTLAVVVTLVVVSIVVIRRRSAGATSDDRRPVLLIIGRFLALLYAGVMTIGVVVNTIVMLVNDTVTVALPVQQFWPEIYPWITLDPAPVASVVGGGFTTADVMVNGLGMDARLALAAGGAVQGLTFIVIASVIALLCHRLLGGTPFRPLLAKSTTWAAAVVAIGGIVWQILFEIGGSAASRQVLQVRGWGSNLPSVDMADYVDSHFEPFAMGLPEPAMGFTVEVWPLLLGIALAAVAVAFRYSERLQKDSEGLV